jgi:hypothetical protein
MGLALAASPEMLFTAGSSNQWLCALPYSMALHRTLAGGFVPALVAASLLDADAMCWVRVIRAPRGCDWRASRGGFLRPERLFRLIGLLATSSGVRPARAD